MARYQVSPIANEACDAINESEILLRTNSLAEAKNAAEHSGCYFGAGILDTASGKLDVGFGFGVPCPDQDDDA